VSSPADGLRHERVVATTVSGILLEQPVAHPDHQRNVRAQNNRAELWGLVNPVAGNKIAPRGRPIGTTSTVRPTPVRTASGGVPALDLNQNASADPAPSRSRARSEATLARVLFRFHVAADRHHSAVLTSLNIGAAPRILRRSNHGSQADPLVGDCYRRQRHSCAASDREIHKFFSSLRIEWLRPPSRFPKQAFTTRI
jgi:hypothetical protein